MSVAYKVNGIEINRLAFEVLPIEDSRRLHVLAKVGRRESASPLRTRVDRSVDFTVYTFSRDDSSDLKIVEDFEWTVPPKLVGKIKSVGSLELTTVAKVDEEIIFRRQSQQPHRHSIGRRADSGLGLDGPQHLGGGG